MGFPKSACTCMYKLQYMKKKQIYKINFSYKRPSKIAKMRFPTSTYMYKLYEKRIYKITLLINTT